MSFELRWISAVGVEVGESRLEGGSKPKVEGEALMWVIYGPRRSGSAGGHLYHVTITGQGLAELPYT
jgi:hypothetical protein